MNTYLTVETVALNRSFRARDLRPLLNMAFRGGNLVMPGGTGQRPYAGVRDQTDVGIEWACDGMADSTGMPHTDPEEGLSLNLAYYRGLFASGDATTGELDAVLHLPNDDYSSTIQCWSWDEIQTGPISATVMTRLVVPSGVWTVVP